MKKNYTKLVLFLLFAGLLSGGCWQSVLGMNPLGCCKSAAAKKRARRKAAQKSKKLQRTERNQERNPHKKLNRANRGCLPDGCKRTLCVVAPIAFTLGSMAMMQDVDRWWLVIQILVSAIIDKLWKQESDLAHSLRSCKNSDDEIDEQPENGSRLRMVGSHLAKHSKSITKGILFLILKYSTQQFGTGHVVSEGGLKNVVTLGVWLNQFSDWYVHADYSGATNTNAPSANTLPADKYLLGQLKTLPFPNADVDRDSACFFLNGPSANGMIRCTPDQVYTNPRLDQFGWFPLAQLQCAEPGKKFRPRVFGFVPRKEVVENLRLLTSIGLIFIPVIVDITLDHLRAWFSQSNDDEEDEAGAEEGGVIEKRFYKVIPRMAASCANVLIERGIIKFMKRFLLLRETFRHDWRALDNHVCLLMPPPAENRYDDNYAIISFFDKSIFDL